MRALTWLFAFGLGASTGTVINFDTAPLGKTPPGWTVAMTNHGGPPKWEIRQDQSAPTLPYVLAQTSNDPTGNRAPLAILDRVKLRDGDVSVRLKPVGGKDNPGGGLVFRYRDENNYYLVRASTFDNSVAVFRVENGKRSPMLAGARHNIPMNAWRILKVSVKGNRFQVYVDHRRILQGQDSTFAQAGGVGLWTNADSITYFDDFRVYPK